MLEETKEVTLSTCRKLRLDNPVVWSHHYGGWTYVVNLIKENLCCDDGVLFITSVEDFATEEASVIDEPWVGVVHQVTKNNYEWFPDLERLVVQETFLKSLKKCLGLYCLSSVISNYLRKHLPDIPVAKVLYPYTPTETRFDQLKFFNTTEKTVLFIGEYMRNFQFFFDLKIPSGFKKVLLQPPDVNFEALGIRTNNSVEIRQYVDNEEYENLLCSSIVLLNLLDAPANTTVLECMIRNAPIFINRLPGLEEYLGENYPLFYDSASEAISLLHSDTSIKKAIQYLENLPIKASLTGEKFLYALQNSATYRLLPVPPSQKVVSQRIPEYDLTVLICSYKRVYNMERLLQSFADQMTEKTYEVIIWNNNFDARDELQLICDGFKDKLNLKVIHSTENYYCIVRLAATSIMRSDILMICDDDVVPKPNFLQVYLDKYDQYGPETVLCCRGHKFWRHDLNEEHPEETWMEYENLKFYNQEHEDIQIHFLHADTCLFPKHLVNQALQTPLPNYDVILVDDYWLSYVFSHILRIPIWKIKGDNLFHSTPCAEDEAIALYKNDRVREERLNFYVYHMRQGWPNSVKCIGEEDDEEFGDRDGYPANSCSCNI